MSRRDDTAQAQSQRETELERWLLSEVISGHAEYLADPSSAVPAADVLARIKSFRGLSFQATKKYAVIPDKPL